MGQAGRERGGEDGADVLGWKERQGSGQCGQRPLFEADGLEIYANRLGLLSYDKENNKFDYIDNKKEEGYFHGTGDLLASSILSCLLNGLTLEKACKTSIKFVYNSVLSTIENKTDLKYGVDFEHNIFNFVKDILESKNE